MDGASRPGYSAGAFVANGSQWPLSAKAAAAADVIGSMIGTVSPAQSPELLGKADPG
jgi:hypothetical protein